MRRKHIIEFTTFILKNQQKMKGNWDGKLLKMFAECCESFKILRKIIFAKNFGITGIDESIFMARFRKKKTIIK